MHEFELIKNYFQKLSKKHPSSLNLNDDVFFDKKNRLVVSVDTYTEGNHFIDFKKPIGNGIITCLNMKQAIIRKKKR